MRPRLCATVALFTLAGAVAGQEPPPGPPGPPEGPDWWSEIEARGPGFHLLEVDSIYRISGSGYDELARAMARHGPGTDEIGTRLGLHRADWRWSYRYRRDGRPGRCRLAEATVILRSVIVLPEWSNRSTAPAGMAERWREFVRALRYHEEGHRARARRLGVTLWQSLLGLEAATCDALRERAERSARHAIEDGERVQLKYDRDTGHGAAQGARWPP